MAPEFITNFETEVKMWTDRTPCIIEYKGGTRLLSPICRWVLTSNYNQDELLSRLANNNDSSNKKAFIRRFQWLQVMPDDTEDADIEMLNIEERNQKCIKNEDLEEFIAIWFDLYSNDLSEDFIDDEMLRMKFFRGLPEDSRIFLKQFSLMTQSEQRNIFFEIINIQPPIFKDPQNFDWKNMLTTY